MRRRATFRWVLALLAAAAVFVGSVAVVFLDDARKAVDAKAQAFGDRALTRAKQQKPVTSGAVIGTGTSPDGGRSTGEPRAASPGDAGPAPRSGPSGAATEQVNAAHSDPAASDGTAVPVGTCATGGGVTAARSAAVMPVNEVVEGERYTVTVTRNFSFCVDGQGPAQVLSTSISVAKQDTPAARVNVSVGGTSISSSGCSRAGSGTCTLIATEGNGTAEAVGGSASYEGAMTMFTEIAADGSTATWVG